MEENQNFKVGDWVFYNKYGVGVVEKECDTNYSIRFEDKSRVINKKYYKNIEKRENDGVSHHPLYGRSGRGRFCGDH